MKKPSIDSLYWDYYRYKEQFDSRGWIAGLSLTLLLDAWDDPQSETHHYLSDLSSDEKHLLLLKAKTYSIANLHGLQAATLFKLSDGKNNPPERPDSKDTGNGMK